MINMTIKGFLNNEKMYRGASQVALVVKNLPANAGDVRDVGSIPGLGRSPGGGNDNSFQYSSLENPMDRGAWYCRLGHDCETNTCLQKLCLQVVTLEG